MTDISSRQAQSSPPISVAVAQMHCLPDEVSANLVTIDAMVQISARDGAQLVIFPETATTGYFIADHLDRLAEPEDGTTAMRLGEIARRAGIHLAIGMAIRRDGAFYDAQLLFGPDGKRLATYLKTHLFSAEKEWFSAGDKPMVVETAIGRVGMTICYDLIFPEFCRKLTDLGADIIINSTNWITDDFQRNIWGWSGSTVTGLATTRALENGVWLAMSNCVGVEGDFDSIGHSCVVAPSGKVVASIATGQGVAVGNMVLESEDLDRWRCIATYLSDRRPELY